MNLGFSVLTKFEYYSYKRICTISIFLKTNLKMGSKNQSKK
jgi:hypothetical protein